MRLLMIRQGDAPVRVGGRRDPSNLAGAPVVIVRLGPDPSRDGLYLAGHSVKPTQIPVHACTPSLSVRAGLHATTLRSRTPSALRRVGGPHSAAISADSYFLCLYTGRHELGPIKQGVVSLRAARVSFLVAAGLLATSYYALSATRTIATALIGALAVAAMAFGTVRQRPERWNAWALLAVAVIMVTVRDISFANAASYNLARQYDPGLPDVLYLLTYPPLALGLVLLGRPALPSRDWAMLLDVIILTLAGSLAVWLVLIRPAMTRYDLTTLGWVAVLASWVGFVAVLAAGGRVAMDWYRVNALRWLSIGVLGFLLADLPYRLALVRSPVSTGELAEAGYHAFAACCGLAALSPSMTTVASQHCAGPRLGAIRVALLGAATLVAPTAVLVQATPGPVTTGVAIAIVAAGVGCVVVVRLAISINNHRRRAARLRAIQTASADLVGAATEREVTETIRTALKSMLPPGTPHDVCLATGPPDRALGRPEVGPVGADGRLTIPMLHMVPMLGEAPIAVSQRGPPHPSVTRVMQFTAPMADLAELAPGLDAITEHASSAVERIELVAKLRSDERERYFRTLVQASRDVTLISRVGRIDYATPSAQDLFGRDVRGERLTDVVRLPSSDGTGCGETDDDGSRQSDGPGEGSGSDDGGGSGDRDGGGSGDRDGGGGRDELGGDELEGCVRKPDGSTLTVVVHERDLTADPTVSGVVAIVRDITQERTLQRNLAYRASHDPLTGLANAEAFQDRLNEATRRERHGQAALFLDLDDFKMINNTYGHDISDRLLEIVARRIESCLRAEDVGARLGGDEFAVLLTQVPNEDAARAVAQRIADALAEPAVIDGVGLSCQASIGLAYGPAGSTTLLREADTALVTAKATGKGRWSQYRDGMTTPIRSHANARQRIERAISAGDLTLHYQPIVDLATAEAVGFEALIRLHDAERPMTPQELIRVADETGITAELGAWTIHQALRDVRRLNSRPGQSRYVSVNVSARQLRQPDFVEVVRAAVRETGADPRLLMLEVTEDLFVGNEYDRAWDFLAELRKDGIRIAIDDYGTGYASLSYLRQPGIDIVKIDQSFVMAATKPRGQTLLSHITALCINLRLGLIAEGIGDTRTRDMLLDLGCTLGQGFFYARAMTLDEAAHWRSVP
jgi:diguanylate cyclase (GGDEF)-like protein